MQDVLGGKGIDSGGGTIFQVILSQNLTMNKYPIHNVYGVIGYSKLTFFL